MATTFSGVIGVTMAITGWGVWSLVAQSIYNDAGVVMMSASSTSPYLTQAGYTTTFRNVPHDGTASNLLARHFRSNLGLSKSAIIETDWWKSPGDIYSDTFHSLGGDIAGRYEITDTANFTSVLTTIQAENPDSIVDFYSVLN